MDQPERATMGRAILVLAIMLLGPPLALLMLAHTGLFPSRWGNADYAILLALGVGGISAMAWSRWPPIVMLLVGIAYTILAIPVLPILGLLAVCSTGNCI